MKKNHIKITNRIGRRVFHTLAALLIVNCSLLIVNCPNPWVIAIVDPKTITFETNGGSYVESQIVFRNYPIKRPSNPTKEGYAFDAWYSDNGTFENIWDFNTIPLTAMTLYANWIYTGVEPSKTEIDSAAITITGPVKDETPDTAAVASGAVNFTIGEVSWRPDDVLFASNTKYTATVTLTANPNYVFAANFTATINEVDADVKTNNGETATISLEFDATFAAAVSGISIKNEPAKSTYIHGDTLDLSGLVVTLAFDDNTTIDFALANFGTNITTTPANGAKLSRLEHNDKPVVVKYGSRMECETGPLTVNRAEGADLTAAPTAASVTANSVTLSAVTAPSNGQTVEYACGTTVTAPTNGWQTGTTFTGLSEGTTYYFFARSKENDNYNAGAAKVSAAVTTHYTVTVTGGTGGGDYAQGATVAITANTPPAGQQFKNWTTTSAGVSFANADSASTTFAMPGNAVSVTANFEQITYAVTVTNGTGSGNYAQGASVAITANTPPSGQQFANWTTTSAGVTFANADSASTTFAMPGNAVTVTANFELIPSIVGIPDLDAYNEALAVIRNGGNNKSYILDITGDITGITPLTAAPTDDTTGFGTATGITVRLASTGTFTLDTDNSNGRMFYLASGQKLIIDGAGLTLRGRTSGEQGHTGNNNAPVITIGSGAELELKNGTITGNTLNGNGGGVVVTGGTFTMTGGTISDNTPTASGGGVYVSGTGTFTITGGTIWGNAAGTSGGGVYVIGTGAFTMTGGTISVNSSRASSGGGVYVGGSVTFTMNGGTISDNSTDSGTGGGVALYDSAAFTMTSGEISGNTGTNGGGVVVTSSTAFTMNGGTISGNTAGGGGGVYTSGTFTMNGGTISGNTTTSSGGGVNVASSANAIFRIVTGTVYGNDEGDTTLQNTATSGAALFKGANGTAQRGTFSGTTWNSSGTLETTDNTIRVVNGDLQN